jgi:hypothetical protein
MKRFITFVLIALIALFLINTVSMAVIDDGGGGTPICGTDNHRFKNSGGSFKCIRCGVSLRITGYSPALTYKTGYRAAPYDKPTQLSGSVKVTFNYTPYDVNGNVMSVQGISIKYLAHNAAWHWPNTNISPSEAQSYYPPSYENGKNIDLKDMYTYTGSRNGKTYTIATPSSTGKYLFRVTVGGVYFDTPGIRRFQKGSPSDDNSTPTIQSELTIKHINIDTGAEIVDSEYTKTVKFNGNNQLAVSLPVGSGIYSGLSNVSYKINGVETARTDANQYILTIPNSSNDVQVIFYYKQANLNVKHFLDSGTEIIDNSYTKQVQMRNPTTLAYSLDIYNNHINLKLTGYKIDNNARVNLNTRDQYIVRVPWNGNSRNITFYYDVISDIKITVKHIDITTGNIMNGTLINTYNRGNAPSSVQSINLGNYGGYQNIGVAINNTFIEKTGTTEYSQALNVDWNKVYKDFEIVFYYGKPTTSDGLSYEYLNEIPDGLSPQETARVGSNEIDNEKYDVGVAIPTSEEVFASIRVNNYLLRYKYSKVSGTKIGKVNFIYTYTDYVANGIDGDGNTIWVPTQITKNDTYEVPRTYEYYKLDYLEVFDVESATFVNAVLPNGAVTILPGKSTLPTVEYTTPSKYIVNEDNLNITINGYVGSQAYADSLVPALQVVNDRVVVEGKVITDSTPKTLTTNKPNKIIPSSMERGVIYKSDMKIDPARVANGEYLTTGNVTYRRSSNIYGTYSAQIVKGINVNSVNVYTPVVNYATINNSEATANNQKIGSPTLSVSGERAKILVLDKTFSISMPNTGTHNNYKGYGNRRYNNGQGVSGTSYAKAKQIRLPFDVYLVSGDSKIFIPKNTWYNLNIAQESFTFLVPVWAKEGAYSESGAEYYIETRVIAENIKEAENDAISSENFNNDKNKYIATKKFFVEVVGRIFDFTITGTDDPNWDITQNIKVTNQPIGQNGQNKVTAYKYAPKLGYSVIFDYKTKGTKSQSVDIMPMKYWYVDKITGEKQEVDLYYNSTTNKFIKIGTTNDKGVISVNISDPDRSVPYSELSDSLRIYNGKYNYTNSNYVGTFTKITLTEALRMSYNNIPSYISQKFYGNKTENTILAEAATSGVKKDDIINANGHWYGEYRLPSSTRAVPKGTVIPAGTSDNSSIFLRNGYIIVQADISTNYVGWDYLSYNKPDENSQWQKENYSQTVVLPNGKTVNIEGSGTVIVYEAGIRASEDYEVVGTH